ncbi:kinase-like domain-containing protein [Scenedesmus sp. NREL 46B-D3]|nr:kinase-like domain-containing protein [Scenedesmus sp. NREL 46B-D3]
MIKSPSLFFDILGEEDELKRNEKIQRASFEIKSQLATTPDNNSGSLLGAAPGDAAAAGSPAATGPASPATAKLWALQQQLLATAAPTKGDSAFDYSCQPTKAAAAAAAAAPAGQDVTDTSTTQQQQQPPHQQEQQTHRQQQAAAQQDQQQPACRRQKQQQQQQQQAVFPPVLSQLTLTPQEVLQELLGDLFIHESRLDMGELLGQGGFADVHAAQLLDPLLGFKQPVAVKRLRPDVLKSPADLREFLTEANLLRKLAHRNIVQLRGVGASDLTDLVTMRESMFVAQEFMAGGDLKALVMTAMGMPFAPPYSKAHALTWAMQVAEALHYLHSVCSPMIIHRDLKLDNVLLSSTNLEAATAKLADFGLHKRVRRLVSSGALVPWSQDTTYRGIDYEPSFYGGSLYLSAKSGFGGAGSKENSVHGSNGGSMHGSLHGAGGARAALNAAGNGDATAGAAEDGTAAAGGSVLLGRRRNTSLSDLQSLPEAPAADGPARPPAYPGSQQQAQEAPAAGQHYLSNTSATLYSEPATSSAQQAAPGGLGGAQQQQQQQLLSAVRAKTQGLLGKQDFVTQVLSARSELIGGSSAAGMMQHSQEVSRTFAAVQALEGSVRAGSAYYTTGTAPTSPAAASPDPEITVAPVPASNSGRDAAGRQQRSQQQPQQQQQSELCPQLLEQLQAGLAAAKDSQKFIEATQKVGSVMYMAPEVLTGHQYNEKIDVFSFGIILYELLSGVVIAGRVAMGDEHDELLDYARKVANGHREALPVYWPASVKGLVAACWAQEPAARPSFKEVLRQLYAMKQAGVDAEMDKARPKGNYNPVTDCGCCIM